MISAKQAKNDRSLELSFTRAEAERYSIARAILSADEPKEKSFEREVSETLSAKLGRPVRTNNSIFIPTRLHPQASGLDSKTNTAGGYTEQRKVLDYVDALRQQMRVVRLGASFLPNLKYSVQIPTETATTTASWVVENNGSDVSQTDTSFGAITGTPHTLQSTTSASRQLLHQAAGNVDLENRLKLDLTKSHAEAFDQAAIIGSGSAGQPVGLLLNPGISTVAIGASGGVSTYANIVDLEAAPANSNADDNIGFLSTPNIRKLLRKTFVNGTGSRAVWGDDGLLGRPSYVSNNVPSTLSKGSSVGTLSAIIAGVWSELILAEWGVLEIVVDPFTSKRRGMVEITSLGLVDVLLPRPAAFAAITDAALS